jgi:chemotaxis signal transduction protein
MTGTSNEELRRLVESAAGPKPPTEAEVATFPMILFRIGPRWLAVPAGSVREVVTLEAITRVPGVHERVTGLALLRGRLVPVVDLPALLGIASGGDAAITRPRLVVLQRDDHEGGVVADEARGVLELPAATTGSATGLVSGELRWNGQIVGVIDADAILAVVAGNAGR